MSRNEQKLAMSRPETQDDWLARWEKSLDVLGNKVYDLRDAREMYNYYVGVVFANPHVDRRNAFLVLIENMYFAYMLVGLRTLNDKDSDSHSLHNLINEVLNHRKQVSREWRIQSIQSHYHDNPTAGELVADGIKPAYEQQWGGEPYPPACLIQDDICRLNGACEKARSIVNKTIAHMDIAHMNRELPPLTLEWSTEVDAAISTVLGLWQKYCLLINGTVWTRAAPPDGWQKIFDTPIECRQ